MGIEYVKLTSPEKTYTEKSLLEIQAQFISILQHLSTYHSARDEELKLKIALKTKVQESQELLETLDKTLPKSHFKDKSSAPAPIQPTNTTSTLDKKAPQVHENYAVDIAETKEQKLQRELEEIKRKLSRL